MKQDKIFEATRKAVETPLIFTNSVREKTKSLRDPSPKIDRLGTALGSCVGVGLVLTGVIQGSSGKPLWALGTMAAGAVTIISNHCHSKKIKG